MMHNINTKVKVGAPNRDTDYLDMNSGVLLGYTFAPYPFIVCQDYVPRTSIDPIEINGFTPKKKKDKKQTISSRNFAQSAGAVEYTNCTYAEE